MIALFFLVVPSVLLLIMVLINVCRHRFSAIETIVGTAVTYIAVLTVLIMTNDIPVFSSLSDMLGNLTAMGCMMVLTYRKTKRILLSGYYVLLTLIISMIGNTVSTIPVLIVFSASIEDIRTSLILHVVLIILTFPVCYALSRFVGNHLRQDYNRLSFDIKEKFVIYGFTLSAFTFILSHVNIFVYRVVENHIILSSVNIMLITSIFFVARELMSAYSRSQQQQMEAEHQIKSLADLESYNRHIGHAYDELRSYHHDHINLLHSLMGFAGGENQGGLKAYLSENLAYTKEILEKLDSSMSRLKFIHIPELRGLLSVKFAYALTKNIDLRIDIINPIEEIPVNRMDLCRMAGIMVDNAIDELLCEELDRKVLRFGILRDAGDILIICNNTFHTPPIIEKLFTKGYTTKGYGRGAGLYNLKKISEQSGNILVTVRKESDEFSLILTIRTE